MIETGCDCLKIANIKEDSALTTDKHNEITTDEELMLAFAQGEASAFDQLYQRHKVVVYRFFIRQNLAVSVAEELTHDTWLKIINAKESYQVSAKFTTYLFTVARRIASDFQQKKSTVCEVTTQESELAQSKNEASKMIDEVNQQGLAKALTQQIANLPFEQREVFLLKQEAGFSLEDISAITMENTEKVKSRWRYALKKLRAGLSFYVN